MSALWGFLSAAVGWLLAIGYVLTTTATAAGVMRWTANHIECRRSYYCHDVLPHWRGDGDVGSREVMTGVFVGLLWPVALIPVAAYAIATRKPTPKANAAYIADLERRCGIGAKP